MSRLLILYIILLTNLFDPAYGQRIYDLTFSGEYKSIDYDVQIYDDVDQFNPNNRSGYVRVIFNRPKYFEPNFYIVANNEKAFKFKTRSITNIPYSLGFNYWLPDSTVTLELEITLIGSGNCVQEYKFSKVFEYDPDVLGTENENVLTIYPNPTQKFCTIELTEVADGFQFELTDVGGRQVEVIGYSEAKTYALQMDMLQSGVYFLEISKSDFRKIYRIIKL